MDKKRKRIPLLASVTALYLITCVVIAILDYCVKGEKQYIVYLKIGSLIVVVVYFIISMVQLLKALWPVFKQRRKILQQQRLMAGQVSKEIALPHIP